jgi:hypothetical protein
MAFPKNINLSKSFERERGDPVYNQWLRRFGLAHETLDFYSLACAARVTFL